MAQGNSYPAAAGCKIRSIVNQLVHQLRQQIGGSLHKTWLVGGRNPDFMMRVGALVSVAYIPYPDGQIQRFNRCTLDGCLDPRCFRHGIENSFKAVRPVQRPARVFSRLA